MKKGDIVTVVAISGEYVGTFDSQLDTTITLTQPKMIVSNPEGGMGFARGVAVTGNENPTVITFNNYVFATESNEGVQNALTFFCCANPFVDLAKCVLMTLRAYLRIFQRADRPHSGPEWR